ncbi:MAG: helix-turn-helix transcriptional regulator [Synergistaceae bacterium]|nr:helix-turn-helix transcriptional regulator [Synergistaceae bacterium]
MTLTSTFPVIDLQKTGRNIEKYRKDSGLTVRDLQEYFGFDYPQAIYKWQHGECLPAVDNLLALALLFGIKIEDLLVYENREVSYPAA